MEKYYDQEIVYSTDRSYYRQMESMQVSPHKRKCIDGKVTGSGKCVGYCRFNGHRGYLTSELRKQHNCLGKDCYYYSPKEKETIFFNAMAKSLSALTV